MESDLIIERSNHFFNIFALFMIVIIPFSYISFFLLSRWIMEV